MGKTEIAKVMAAALDRELVRLQCYEGLDESKALYEWNYQKQLLAIQIDRDRRDSAELAKSLFSDGYLLERPLLKSIRSEKPVVLLIDEIDKADEEFEAFLLELLSEMQVSIPEIGTLRAKSVPFVVLTSNRSRPLGEALRRRCAYLYIQYPSLEKEVAPAGKQYSQLLILSWEPGLKMCWYRGKLGSPVRWGWGAQGHLSEDKGDGWHPAHTGFWPSS